MRTSPVSSHSLSQGMASSRPSHSDSDGKSSGAQGRTPHYSLPYGTAGLSMPRVPAELVDDGNNNGNTFSHELCDRYSWRSLPDALRPASQVNKVKTLEELVRETAKESQVEMLKDVTRQQCADFETFCTNHAADAHVHITEFERYGLKLEELMQVTLEVGDCNPEEELQIWALLADQQEDIRTIRKLQKED